MTSFYTLLEHFGACADGKRFVRHNRHMRIQTILDMIFSETYRNQHGTKPLQWVCWLVLRSGDQEMQGALREVLEREDFEGYAQEWRDLCALSWDEPPSEVLGRLAIAADDLANSIIALRGLDWLRARVNRVLQLQGIDVKQTAFGEGE